MADQRWSASGYAANAPFVPALGNAVLEMLAPQPGELVLDVGCGDGVLTQRIADAGAAVIGIDSSPEMIAAAQARGLDARVQSATELTFTAEFDAVFTNAALHWIKAADTVIAGVSRALKPGGRFVGEFGGHGNVAAITVALIAVLERRGIANAAARIPWFYPTPLEYKALLEQGGFVVDSVQLIPRPTPLPTGMRGWLETFANPFCAALPADERDNYLDEVTALLKPVLCDQQGNWTADYARLRFAAHKPQS